jgi:hypothetical protein
MPHYPTLAVVWLDFHQAKIFLIKADDVEAKRVKADTPHRQIHHKAQVRGSGHVRDDRTYFEAILAALEGVDAWLIVGPGETKNGRPFEVPLPDTFTGHIERYIAHHRPQLVRRSLSPASGEPIRALHVNPGRCNRVRARELCAAGGRAPQFARFCVLSSRLSISCNQPHISLPPTPGLAGRGRSWANASGYPPVEFVLRSPA